MRSILDRARRCYRGLGPEAEARVAGLPVARRYILRSSRASLALRGLRAWVMTTAQAAVLEGEASPAETLGVVLRCVEDLAAWWGSLGREQIAAKGRIS